MKKIWHVAGILAVLGGGIALGTAVGRSEKLWQQPAAPDTGAGWVAPKGTVDLVGSDSGQASEPTATKLAAATPAVAEAPSTEDDSPGYDVVAEAQGYYRDITSGNEGEQDAASVQCVSKWRIQEAILRMVAVAAPMAPTYPIPGNEPDEFYIVVPDMGSVTTEGRRGASKFCSVNITMGILNRATGEWRTDYPPLTHEQMLYEIVMPDTGPARAYSLNADGTRVSF